ncbi:uncharacterized protein LOC122853816 [Aphidius gifuensis]|uniref:uncharacterized protein LOC122853816 n=1 Tax=Aphidius gifuensis TaxID=684658 RepID=UPI001CDB7839|nr:uncharacterized protein LOC122853816 [Aphidius gifuensis]
MFRQIKVHGDDWDLQRILWFNEHNQEQHYHLNTVTYGTRAAPFLAVRTLLQLVEDEGQRYPQAVPSLLKGRYVDDIFGGGDTPEQLKESLTNSTITEHARWRHVPGTQNPADCASRGITSEQLEHNELWWSGPPWLVKPENTWPKQSSTTSGSSLPEERPGLTLLATKQETKEPWTLIEKHSSVTKLFKITALCLRFISILRKNPIKMHGAIDQAKTFWIKSTQSIYFSQEIKTILDNRTLASSHPFSKLTAFIDAQGILRVGGRLENTVLSYETKHQAILPRSARLTTLLIDYAHKSTLHGGTQLTLGHMRQHYWIIGGRASVKAHILRCVECARQRGIRAHQLLGQLPLSRVTPTRAFEHTGIDYAGPIILKNWNTRGAKTYKGWICAFVCMTTSAAHLELVTKYTTEAFLATYKRFTSRRGIPAHLYSDCGTNFIGAERELKILFTQHTKENQVLENKILENTTRWHFNPPGAPHMGGKWEALIKSTKYHLKRTIGESKMTYEEASTLLTQIEAILNSRPLEPLSDDPDDLQTLTPGHFLTGTSLMAVPEPCLLDLSTSRLSRWQFIQQITQPFCSQWSSQYLQRQQSISKWHHVNNKIQVGSLILISDERAPPCRWPLGRITKLLPGADGNNISIGLMDNECTYCKALKYKKEPSGLCCANGKIKLPALRSPIEPLLSYLIAELTKPAKPGNTC